MHLTGPVPMIMQSMDSVSRLKSILPLPHVRNAVQFIRFRLMDCRISGIGRYPLKNYNTSFDGKGL